MSAENATIKYTILENGQIYDMSRASRKHNELLSRLCFEFQKIIKPPCSVERESSYRWEQDVAPYRIPDLSIVCEPSSKNDIDIDSVPLFIAEILSKNTEHIDCGEKFDLYGKIGVKEYWIIDPDTLSCKIFVNESDHFDRASYEECYLNQLDEISLKTNEKIKIDLRSNK